jgi:hypothetical protein
VRTTNRYKQTIFSIFFTLTLLFGQASTLLSSTFAYAQSAPSPQDITPTVAPAPVDTIPVSVSTAAPEPQPTLSQPVDQITTPPPPVSSNSTPPPQATPPTSPSPDTGPSSPTGASAATYVFNEQTGLWENDLYTWSQATNKTTPKQPQEYSYNPNTKVWETKVWSFDAASGTYVPNTISTSVPPQTAQTTPQNDSNKSANPTTTNPLTLAALSPNSAEQANSTSSTSNIFDNFFNASISGSILSNARSGGANIFGNTAVGSVDTGNASSINNVVNILNSSWGYGGNPSVSTFLANINGDVFGDLTVNPEAIFAKNNLQVGGSNTDTKLTVNTAVNGQINNNIVANANSGDAALKNNTKVGDTSTGTADAVANVVDLMNSNIASGQSFIGTVNIYGNLDGDILFPKGFIDQAVGTQNNSVCVVCSSADANYKSQITDQITNKVRTIAQSGKINAAQNTSIGDTTTGDSNTNVSVYNLTGKQIVGKNALMVFVNVLGSWVGFIVDSPEGSKTALLGSNVESTNTQPIARANTVETNTTSTNKINNNILASAKTGSIDAQSNTSLGNLTTGDATASVNIVDFINSRLLLSSWFGMLFINVFGSWHGSFGVDTTNGNAPLPSTTPIIDLPLVSIPGSPGSVPVSESNTKVFAFRPSSDNGGKFEPIPNAKVAAVLGVSSSNKTPLVKSDSDVVTSLAKRGNQLPMNIAVAIAIFSGYIVLSRLRRKASNG